MRRFFSILTHVNSQGKASMVDVGHKQHTLRKASASGKVIVGSPIFQAILQNNLKKGDVLTVSRLAGILGAKQTSNLIPLCHPIFLSQIIVDCTLEAPDTVSITSSVSTTGQTGVEMEALTAVSVAALTVYDMCKAMSKDIRIQDIQLESKSGGNSGDFYRHNEYI
jgi:molybdenum cofactor biosynthesis protein MoaC